MKNKVIFIILVILGVGLVVFGGLTLFSKEEEKKDAPKAINGFDLEDFATLETCLDESCENKLTDYYSNITYDYDSDVLQNALDKINKKTKKYYEVANSSVKDAVCPITPSVNTKGTRISSFYNYYSDGNVIIVHVNRNEINICNNNNISYEPDNFVYDIKEDKLLNFEEAKEKLSVTDDDILAAIKKTNDGFAQDRNMTIATQDSYSDSNLYLYYNTIGELYVAYPVPELNGYKSALLREKE